MSTGNAAIAEIPTTDQSPPKSKAPNEPTRRGDADAGQHGGGLILAAGELSIADQAAREVIALHRANVSHGVGGADVLDIEIAVRTDRRTSPGSGDPIQTYTLSGPRGTIEQVAAALDRFVAGLCSGGALSVAEPDNNGADPPAEPVSADRDGGREA